MLNFTGESDSFEIREFARTVRRFAEDELTGSEFQRESFNKMAELGLPGMTISEEDGGTDFSHLGITAALFEIARVRLGPVIYLSVHLMVSKLIRRWADNQALENLLPELASAKSLAAFCLTEAQAGSDASALKTRAEKKNDTWVLNGEKIYISSSGLADVYLVFARTGDDKKKGISAFVVDKNSPGLTLGKPEKKMGCAGSPIANVTFDNCTIPSDALLGGIGDGYKIALSGLSGGRVNMGAAACGLASRSIELAKQHLKERKQFGTFLADFQGLQFMLADMATKFRASVLLTRDAAIEIDKDSERNAPSSMAKLFASDAAMEITTNGVQLLGGAGYLEDYEVERLMRDAKMLQIVEGTNQIQRVLIARSLLNC